MYRIRSRGYSKHNAEQRWALPDRVFFAYGACHILAYAFLERYGFERGQPLWLKPAPGFTGNHIFIAMDEWVFDYHGISRPQFPARAALVAGLERDHSLSAAGCADLRAGVTQL